MNFQKRLLVIGTEEVRRALRHIIVQMPVQADWAETVEEALSRLRRPFYDAVLAPDNALGGGGRAAYVARLKGLSGDLVLFTFSEAVDFAPLMEAAELGCCDYITHPFNAREIISRLNAVLQRKTRVSCIGGGTGLFSLLMGLKILPGVFLSSIVSMTDDGGSSGRLRASFGVLPPGDVRRSLVALSNAPELMNEVLQYRFERSEELRGHSFGNLFLTALAEIKGSMGEAVRGLGDILNIQGLVLPATTTPTVLCASFEGGTVVRGESKIDQAEERHPDLRITGIWHEPEADCDLNAFAAILFADIVTIGPGDLFTSVATNLVVRHLASAVKRSRAKKVYICNLMTKPGETAGFDATQHVEEIIKYLGADCLDYIVLSNTPVSERACAEYARKGQMPVELKRLEQMRSFTRAELIVADVGHETELVRHDSFKIQHEVGAIIAREAVRVRREANL